VDVVCHHNLDSLERLVIDFAACADSFWREFCARPEKLPQDFTQRRVHRHHEETQPVRATEELLDLLNVLERREANDGCNPLAVRITPFSSYDISK
jgi:hypothetical protein